MEVKKTQILIAFEGIDGAGKYTVLSSVRAWLKSLGYRVECSSEPNGESSPLGKHIRAILKGELPMPEPLEMQRLYVLDRAQDIACLINPFLRQGGVYLIERFAFSTIAYGMCEGIPLEKLVALHTEVMGDSMRWPDLTVILDLSGREAVQRIAAGRDHFEYFEKEEKLETIRQNYLAIAAHPRFKDATVVIDGAPSPEEVFKKTKEALVARF